VQFLLINKPVKKKKPEDFFKESCGLVERGRNPGGWALEGRRKTVIYTVSKL
jgi:hypothetical protein